MPICAAGRFHRRKLKAVVPVLACRACQWDTLDDDPRMLGLRGAATWKGSEASSSVAFRSPDATSFLGAR